MLDSLRAPIQQDQRGSRAALGLGTIDRSIHAVQKYQRSAEVTSRLLGGTIQERGFTEGMRERRHRLVVADILCHSSQRCRAAPSAGSIARFGEEGGRPAQQRDHIVTILSLLPALQDGPAVTCRRLGRPFDLVDDGQPPRRQQLHRCQFDPARQGERFVQ